MKILFRKILKYELKKNQENSYFYVCSLLSQKIDPESLQKKEFVIKTMVALGSNLKRSRQCIKKDKKVKIRYIKILNEIPFDFRSHSNQIEFKKKGSIIVRRVFKKLFIQDGLIVKRREIFREIEELFKYININFSHESSLTIVSHSFRLKCIEAYLKTNKKILQNPKLINKYILNTEKTFDFGEGFDFDI